MIDSFPCFYLYVRSRQPENGKWTLRIKWIILDLLMRNHSTGSRWRLWWLQYTKDKEGRRYIIHRTWYHRSSIDPTIKTKKKWDKITAFYRHLNVTGNPVLCDIDRFMIKKKNEKQATLTCFFSMVNIGNPLLINLLVSF